MNKIEAKEKFNIINRYNYAQPIQHLWITKEKELYNERLRKREKVMLSSLDRVKNTPKYTFFNHLRKFISNKDITQAMITKEEKWAEYLI